MDIARFNLPNNSNHNGFREHSDEAKFLSKSFETLAIQLQQVRSCKENKQNSFSLLLALVRVYGFGYLSKSMLPRPQNLIRTVFFLFLNFAAADRFVYISPSRSLFRETQQTCTLLSSLLLFHTLLNQIRIMLFSHTHTLTNKTSHF